MLNHNGQFFDPWDILDSHHVRFWPAAQSLGFMPCVPSRPRSAADGAETIHPIALVPEVRRLATVNDLARIGAVLCIIS
jgi:hypothetical protein